MTILFSCINFGVEMDAFVLILFVAFIVACVMGYRWIMRKGTDKFYKLMEDTNQKHGTSFGTTRDDVHTVLGTNALYGIMAFDQKNRKIAYVTKSGKSIEVLDFSYIRSWNTTWTENTTATAGQGLIGTNVQAKTSTSNVAIEIGTNDLKRPLIKIRVPSMAYADQWNSRLSILLNA